jgi:hypothetical protein
MCLYNVGVRPIESKTSQNRQRQFPVDVDLHLGEGDAKHWIHTYARTPIVQVLIANIYSVINLFITGLQMLQRLCSVISLYSTGSNACTRVFNLSCKTVWYCWNES